MNRLLLAAAVAATFALPATAQTQQSRERHWDGNRSGERSGDRQWSGNRTEQRHWDGNRSGQRHWDGNRQWSGGYSRFAPRYYGAPRYFGYPRYYSSPYWYPGPAYIAPYFGYPLYSPAPPVYVERYYIEEAPPRVYREPQYAEVAPPPRTEPLPKAAPAPAPLERMTLSAKELFEFDRANLRSPQPKLDEIADVMRKHPEITSVRITGYTDRLGTESYNQKLSERRAAAVKNYLVGKGVAANRLQAVGRGEANPVVECHDAKKADLIKCLEPNRRVEVEPITVTK